MPGYDEDSVDNVFTYHKPTPGQTEKYKSIRDMALELADNILFLCPQAAETTTAINKVREAVMWANASIACNEGVSNA